VIVSTQKIQQAVSCSYLTQALALHATIFITKLDVLGASRLLQWPNLPMEYGIAMGGKLMDIQCPPNTLHIFSLLLYKI
jgi:hypothetical protein